MDGQTLAHRLGRWGTGGGPLYAELSDALRRLVANGELMPGSRMPSERDLAAALNVSRGTVTAAYDALRSADVLRGHRGRGTVVVGTGVPGQTSVRARVFDILDTNVVSTALESGAIDLRPSYWIDDAGLPASALSQADTDLRAAISGPGYLPAGLPELREAIAAHHTSRGLATDANQILITTGAQQAINLVAQMLLRPGDEVAVEDPTYIGALDAFAVVGARSIDIADRERSRVWYVTAEVRNPTGNTMAEDEKVRLVTDACERGALLIDDQAIAEIWLGARRPPSLAAIAEERHDPTRVITIGSAGKTFWGGLRVGWIRAAASWVDALTRLKAIADVGSPLPSQYIAARLFPHVDPSIRERLEKVRRRRDTLVRALNEQLPDWSFDVPDGGLSLWVRISGDGRAFASVASAAGVGVIPGSLCTAGDGHRDRIRLTFGLPEDLLVEAVNRLATAWREFTAGDASSARYEVVV